MNIMNITETGFRQRSSIEDLYRQSRYFSEQWHLQFFANSVSEYLTVLNKNNQIVFSNHRFAQFMNVQSTDESIGARPCEALQCATAAAQKQGGGIPEACTMCGIYKAQLQNQNGKPTVQECRINRTNNLGALELMVRATPLTVEGEMFSVFAYSDISHEKRRRVLESLFFHDTLNTLGGLMGYSEMLTEADQSETIEFATVIQRLAAELSEQIESQRELAQAENFEIATHKTALHSKSLLTNIVGTFTHHKVGRNKKINIDSKVEDFVFLSDETLLKRILGNLVKNALEATKEEGEIFIGCKLRDDELQFWVYNSDVIPHDVQLQIFQRSFSTKGEGRGLGTYSVKLFTERCLGGHVSFVSNKEDGTIFTVTIPTITRQPQITPQQKPNSIEEIFH